MRGQVGLARVGDRAVVARCRVAWAAVLGRADFIPAARRQFQRRRVQTRSERAAAGRLIDRADARAAAARFRLPGRAGQPTPAATSTGSKTTISTRDHERGLHLPVSQQRYGDAWPASRRQLQLVADGLPATPRLTSSLSAGQLCSCVSRSARWRMCSSRAGSELAIQYSKRRRRRSAACPRRARRSSGSAVENWPRTVFSVEIASIASSVRFSAPLT